MRYVCENCGHSDEYGIGELEIECSECGGKMYEKDE